MNKILFLILLICTSNIFASTNLSFAISGGIEVTKGSIYSIDSYTYDDTDTSLMKIKLSTNSISGTVYSCEIKTTTTNAIQIINLIKDNKILKVICYTLDPTVTALTDIALYKLFSINN